MTACPTKRIPPKRYGSLVCGVFNVKNCTLSLVALIAHAVERFKGEEVAAGFLSFGNVIVEGIGISFMMLFTIGTINVVTKGEMTALTPSGSNPKGLFVDPSKTSTA